VRRFDRCDGSIGATVRSVRRFDRCDGSIGATVQ
jgi:hypothetical protein